MSCNSATHHMYDAQRPDAQPLASFSGHRNGSFYIRACFSPDGNHILSGSSDEKAHIWAVRSPGSSHSSPLDPTCESYAETPSQLIYQV